jgi:hypothetical protein
MVSSCFGTEAQPRVPASAGSAFLAQLAQVPRLGFGIGLKDVYFDALQQHPHTADPADQIDWLEIIPENHMDKGGYSRHGVEALLDVGYPMASHGVNLSLGSVDALNPAYLDALEALFAWVQPVWFSDHLSFSSVDGHYFNDLIPLPWCQEAVALCVDKIRQLQARFQRPFLIENISYYAQLPHPDGFSEAEFITRIVEAADCGLLLDVNNVYVNSRNHGGQPQDFINALPLERVVEIHLAGHLETSQLVIDTHAEPLRPEVLALFADVYPRCPNLKAVLLERDSNFPPFDRLLQELHSIREAAMASRPGCAQAGGTP